MNNANTTRFSKFTLHRTSADSPQRLRRNNRNAMMAVRRVSVDGENSRFEVAVSVTAPSDLGKFDRAVGEKIAEGRLNSRRYFAEIEINGKSCGVLGSRTLSIVSEIDGVRNVLGSYDCGSMHFNDVVRFFTERFLDYRADLSRPVLCAANPVACAECQA